MLLINRYRPTNISKITNTYISGLIKSLSTSNFLPSNAKLADIDEDKLTRLKKQILFNSVVKVRHKTDFHDKRKALEARRWAGIDPLPLSLKFVNNETVIEEPKTIEPPTKSENKRVQFPFSGNNSAVNEVHIKEDIEEAKTMSERVDKEIRERNEQLRNWMNAYENLECDIKDTSNVEDDVINYGTPDPRSNISNVPCGGCGAFIHCKDASIPGYIPSEIFKTTEKHQAQRLESLVCQRCFFLKEHNIALQVRVSPDDYPKILASINPRKSLVLLTVDLTDFPCSIWPGIADIFGPKTPIVLVGNKIDLLPKDTNRYLTHIKRQLLEQIKLTGFGTANITDTVLVSAKTGYGIEDLINTLQRQWSIKNVYLVGCTNVGKSSLFNSLLASDYCKHQVSDLIQRATISHWPGTTLNLLKFPVARASHYRLYYRSARLFETNKRLVAEEERRKEALQQHNTPENATLMGRIERTFPQTFHTNEPEDTFTVHRQTHGLDPGLREHHPDFASSRWCYDTPGVVHPDQMLDLLTLDELVLALPKELIRPETFCVRPGSSLFIAGLARLDYIEGPGSVRLTVFRSNELPVTVCEIEKADEVYAGCLGTELFRVPIDEGDRLGKWPGLEAGRRFTVKGVHERFSTKDVVLSNAGWVAISCYFDECIFQGWTPGKRGIHVRDSVLPKAVTLRGKRIRDSVAYLPHRFL
ncbi:unnamed protein product [Phyllotreta striolata]|uniref:G domain-containing protein n=1 Tax=Phyllotreta striolata TaxID=444603 RepID=A0A9N9TNR3_PHYSR|nr:unnamed protein product [Phyllotreta striolata]